jgi:hypothetical protein
MGVAGNAGHGLCSSSMMGMEEENMQLLLLPLHHRRRRRQQLLPRLLLFLMYATIWLLNVCMPKFASFEIRFVFLLCNLSKFQGMSFYGMRTNLWKTGKTLGCQQPR